MATKKIKDVHAQRLTKVAEPSISKKEKTEMKKIAKQVADAHKGTEKPQLLQAIKGEEKVTLCHIPVVRWAIYRDEENSDKGTLKTITAKREVSSLTIETTAAEAKAIKDKCDNDMNKVVVEMICKFHDEIVNNGWSVSDLEAIFLVRKSVLKKVESIATKYEYDDNVDARKFFFEASTILRSVRNFSRQLAFFKNAVDEKFRILPDMDKYVVQDRKFVLKSQTYPIKPAPKKTVTKKK